MTATVERKTAWLDAGFLKSGVHLSLDLAISAVHDNHSLPANNHSPFARRSAYSSSKTIRRQPVFSSSLAHGTHGLTVTYAVWMRSASRHCATAFCSACTA